MPNHDVVVVGASLGGIDAISKLVRLLPEDLPASVFVVQHLSPTHRSVLDQILSRQGSLPAVCPKEGDEIRPGTVYVAPPDHHLLVKQGRLAVTFGPRENRSRPSIDVLFRSAAASYGSRVIAVLLTGYLDDGVLGLSDIKRCGGTVIVQDPSEAEAPDLPQTAIDRVDVDYVLPLEQIASKIIELTKQPAGEMPDVPEDIMEEIKAAEHTIPDLDDMAKIGRLTPFTCPECGGALWEVKEAPVDRYLCHTGHSFTTQSYLDSQSDAIEYSLWSAVRYLQERAKILANMAEGERQKGRPKSAEELETRAVELRHHAKVIRSFIVSGKLVAAVNTPEPREVPTSTQG